MNVRKAEFNVISYQDLQEKFYEFFDIEDFDAFDECPNGAAYALYDITNVMAMSGLEEINAWLDGDDTPDIRLLLNALCLKGQIEEGNYLIEVNW